MSALNTLTVGCSLAAIAISIWNLTRIDRAHRQLVASEARLRELLIREAADLRGSITFREGKPRG